MLALRGYFVDLSPYFAGRVIMDVNVMAKIRLSAVAVLAASSLGISIGATAPGVSTIAISTDAADADVGAMAPAAGSQLVICASDLDAGIPEAVVAEDSYEEAASPQAPVAAGQGQLTVIANQSRVSQATATVSDRDVMPAVAEESLTLPAATEPTVAAADIDPASALFIQAHRLSQTASSEADYSQIVRWCAEGLRQEPDGEAQAFAVELSAWALTRRGQLRTDVGDADLGLADFSAALSLSPNYWRALHHRGVTRAQTGQFADAFDDVCRVIQLNPKFAKAYANRATLYAQAGDLDKALVDYQRAIEVDPKLTVALVGYARACHLVGRRAASLASFTAAIEQSPQDAQVYCSRGDLLADLGRYDEALADYATAIDLEPQFEHAYRNGAWLLATCPHADVRDAEGALVGAQKSLECGYGDRHAALDTLAAAQANAGQFDAAVSTMTQAIAVAPPEARAAYAVRKQLYESGRPFRSQPVAGVQAAKFVEDEGVVACDGGGVEANSLQSGYVETF
jgi:tetratricopeptide (TPR) repeat protein